MEKSQVHHVEASPARAAGGLLLADVHAQAGRPAPTAPSMTELLLASLRYKWMMFVIFVLVATPISILSWTLFAPRYQAKGEVRIRPIIPALVFNTDENGRIPFYNSFVNTQIAIIKGPTVLQRVLDVPQVRESEWFKDPLQSFRQKLAGHTPTPMSVLKNNLSASARRGTEIVDVSFWAGSLDEAKLVTDTALRQYIEYAQEMSEATKDEIYNQLTNQYKTLEEEIKGREAFVALIRKRLGTHDPRRLINNQRMHLDEMQFDLSEVRKRIALLEWEVKQAGAADNTGAAGDAPVSVRRQAAYHENLEWIRLDTNLRTLKHQCATSMLTEKHPDMIRLLEDMEFAEESLRLHEARLDEQWANGRLNSAAAPVTITGVAGPGYNLEIGSYPAEHLLAQAREEEKHLAADLAVQKANFNELFEDAELLESENNTILHKRQLFAAVRQRLDQKNMERNVPGSIEVLTWAAGPPEPYHDRRVTFAGVGVFMALAASFGAALLRAGRNQTIYAFQDMPPTLRAPLLGHIPLTRIRRPLGKSLYAEMQRIRDHKIESIRVVRTALLTRLNGHPCATVLITSAAEGTGKSTFTMMLGQSLAQSGKKVIMIDADLRRRTLSKRSDLAQEPGFMESLRSKSVDRRYIFPTKTPGLSILTAGVPDGDGSVFEGTANGAFKACIEQLRRDFDIVLVDSSPILPVADATILSSQVDGTIMVERELISQRGNVVDALARLNSAGGRLMGTVFIGSGLGRTYGSS
jgi:capsular exopolysaccharide synthesis family protein